MRRTKRQAIQHAWRKRHIAEFAGVTPRAVFNWKRDGKLPPPDYNFNGEDAWEPQTIKQHFAANQERAA